MLDAIWAADRATTMSVNSFAGKSELLDAMVLSLDTHLFKGVFVMMLFWGLWFAKEHYGSDTREKLAALTIVAISAIFIGRSLALALPFRDRPIHDQELDLNIASGMDPNVLVAWSSLPSDHAVLNFALAAGLCRINVWVGALALTHATVVVSLPRVFLGLHFVSDVLLGAIIGVACSLLILPPLARFLVRRNALRLTVSCPHLFYPAMFFITFQIASMFESLRMGLSRFMVIVQTVIS